MEVRPIVQTFQAGVPTVIPVGGRYFRVTANVNPFTLEIGRDGQYIASIPGSVVGDSGECKDGDPNFDALRITTSGTESVSILITDGSIRRDSQNSDVSDRAARLLGVVYGSLAVPFLQILSNSLNLLGTLIHGTLGQIAQVAIGGVNALQVTERGFTYGAAFGSTTLIGAASNEQVVAPGSNTNGMIVWDAEAITGQGAGTGTLILLAKSSAPATSTDGDVIAAWASDASVTSKMAKAFRPVFIASGKGLYYRAATAETFGIRKVIYTLL